MTQFAGLSLKVRNYKCFGDTPEGFDSIRPINLIVGKNNSGKSALLEIIDYATERTGLPTDLGYKGAESSLVFSMPLTGEEIEKAFLQSASAGGIPGTSHWDYGKRWIDQPLTWALKHKQKRQFIDIDPPNEVSEALPNLQQLATQANNPFKHLYFKRLYSDRDIRIEGENDTLDIKNDGTGLTNTVRGFLNRADLDSALVERTMLDDLNTISAPDARFSDILVQQYNDKRWEIYLEEEGKGRIPLTHTGSGFKTILLVLAFVHLLPAYTKVDLDSFIFGFEELENNLHPSLHRRLLLYIRGIAEKWETSFFITTHSSVAIDMFSSDEMCQIVHVTHDGDRASSCIAKTYVENKGVLDDLDVRASDLLQSNAIVWVEGPSDRLYFNRWMELASDGEVHEGQHYQCIFYGGRLLWHLSAKEPDIKLDDLVQIFRVNRNAILMMDSDKTSSHSKISPVKKRIITELDSVGGRAWLTNGREIENYIPMAALRELYGNGKISELGQYQEFAEYLDSVKVGIGKRFKRSKVVFAEQVCPHMTKENINGVYDLMKQINSCKEDILRWNGQR